MADTGRQKSEETDSIKRHVTLRDIAAQAGVSATAVSFALRGMSGISEKLRTQIVKVAGEMGYDPDERMGALARYRHDSREQPGIVMLAWVNLWDDPAQLHTYREFELYYRGASLAAEKLGFRMREFTAKGLSPRQLAARLKKYNVKGLLIAPGEWRERYMCQLPLDKFTAVRFGLEAGEANLHAITADQLENGKLAFRKVRQKGYERIGFVTEKAQRMPFGGGVFWEQKECPKSERIPFLMFSTKDAAERRKMFAEWMAQWRPDAVLTDLAELPKMIQELGLRIPEDIAMATTSIRDTPIDTGIDQHPEETGRIALLTLISLLSEKQPGTPVIQNQTMISGSWVEGSMMPSKDRADEKPAIKECTASLPATPAVEECSPGKSDSGDRRVTQRDIAKAAGVSHMTVSLALRNDSRCSEKTRTRIQQKAEAMGYVPDPMLSALGSYCRSVRKKPVQAALAWLNLWPDPKKLYTYPEFKGYWEGAAKSARRLGYQLEEFSVRDIRLPRLDNIFKTRNIRGILLPPSPLPAIADMDQFPWRDYTAIQLGMTSPVPLRYAVAADSTANSTMALEQIMKKGYRRIAFVGDRAVQRTFGAGFYWAQRMLPEQLPAFFFPLKEPERHRLKLAAWIHKEQPDAILTDNAAMPEILEELGIRVPGDIGLATTIMFNTPIDAGIDHNAAEVGRMGVLSLVAHMKETRRNINEIESTVYVRGSWIDGTMLPARN